MTEQTLRHPGARIDSPRHRHAADLGSPWGAVLRPTWVKVALTVLATLMLTLGLGYTVLNQVIPGGFPSSGALPGDPPAGGPPPGAAPGGAPPDVPAPTGSPAPAVPPPSASPSPSGVSPSPSRPPSGTPAPPSRRPAPPPERRRIGPSSLDGFQRLLADFCADRGQRTALLLKGADDRSASGEWVCVRVVTFTPINLDQACRAEFGKGAKARQTTTGDARSWRCFDS